MKKFKVWLTEGIQHKESSGNIKSILEELDINKIIRFALYCAKDVFHFTYSNNAHTCIQEIEKALEGNVNVDKLHTVATEAQQETRTLRISNVSASRSLESAANAANTAYLAYTGHPKSSVVEAARLAAFCASINRPKGTSIHEALTKYENIARSFHSTTNRQTQSQVRNYSNSPEDLAIFLDEMEEENENLIVNSKLNIPGVNVAGEDNMEIARNIFKSPQKNHILNILKDLYK